MSEDPIVEEVREAREGHAVKLNYDLAAICRDLKRQQEEEGWKVVSLPPRRLAVGPTH